VKRSQDSGARINSQKGNKNDYQNKRKLEKFRIFHSSSGSWSLATSSWFMAPDVGVI
jgi:hypothetical protein